MKEFKNIPIFQYGMNSNGVYISKEVVEKSAETFKNAPIIDYRENDKGIPIGMVQEVTDINNDFVYGDVIMWQDHNVPKDFYNYEICVNDYHIEDKISVIDDFTLFGVSLEIKSK